MGRSDGFTLCPAGPRPRRSAEDLLFYVIGHAFVNADACDADRANAGHPPVLAEYAIT